MTPAVRVRMLMGLPFSLHVRGADAGIDTAADRIWARLERDEQVFSPYLPDSEISSLATGSVDLANCSTALGEVLALAEEARRRTGGFFDLRNGGRLDPSGVVKGWAAERAFRACGLDEAYLNAGGDLTLTGSWRIGVEHPADPTGLLAVVQLHGGGIATSGRAHRGAHLWDPTTGRTAGSRWQATVIGPTLTWSDILATAAAVAGPERLDRSGWPVGYEVLLADPQGEVRMSPGFREHLAGDIPAPEVAGPL